MLVPPARDIAGVRLPLPLCTPSLRLHQAFSGCFRHCILLENRWSDAQKQQALLIGRHVLIQCRIRHVAITAGIIPAFLIYAGLFTRANSEPYNFIPAEADLRYRVQGHPIAYPISNIPYPVLDNGKLFIKPLKVNNASRRSNEIRIWESE